MKYAIGIGIAAALVAIFGFVMFSTKVDDVQVTSHHWRIEQQIEDFQARAYEGWDETVPSDAYSVSCRRRQRGAHQQWTGQICTGTGTNRICTNQYITVPDYDDWCGYTANRWGYLTSHVNEGELNDTILVPEPSTRCTEVEEFGCERYGQLIRTFTISFLRASDNSTFDCNYEREYWASLVDGNTYKMVFGSIFNESRCELTS